MFKAESVMFVDRADVRVGVSRPGVGSVLVGRAVDARPVWLKRVVSIAGLIVVVWSVPFLVFALPLAFAWRAVLQATRWR